MGKNITFKYWPITLLIFLSLATSWPIFAPGYFSHHDDLQVMRIFEMRHCLQDLQIPCRWVPDLGFGNGYPLFNYYSVLPYYIGAILSSFIGYIAAAKVLFLIPLLLGGIAIYLVARDFFGKIPATLAGALFILAPYRALDTYVRGAVAENFAMAIFPLILFFGFRLTKLNSYKYFLGLILSLAAFLISHNIMALIFFPVFILLILYWQKISNWKNAIFLTIAIILGIGLSLFFTLPAFFEKDLVQIDNLTKLDLDFRAHFVTINQLFLDRSWGYGASFPGPKDTISLQVGWPHWWIVGLAFLIFIIFYIKDIKKNLDLFFLLLFLIFLFSIFMTHNKSAFIWESIGILRFVQFPWRFLSIVIFASSLMGAYFVSKIPDKFKIYFVFVTIALTVTLNFNYFQPETFYPDLNDEKKLSGELWKEQQRAAILDYLPKTAYEPREAPPENPIVVSGKAETSNFNKKSNRFDFGVKVTQNANIEVPIFDFPNWIVYVNGNKFNHAHDNFLGRIRLDLESGEYKVTGYFKDTPIRETANLLTLGSLIILIIFKLYGKRFFV